MPPKATTSKTTKPVSKTTSKPATKPASKPGAKPATKPAEKPTATKEEPVNPTPEKKEESIGNPLANLPLQVYRIILVYHLKNMEYISIRHIPHLFWIYDLHQTW